MPHFLEEDWPDLGDEWRGIAYDSDDWGRGYYEPAYTHKQQPMFVFYSEQDLVTSDVFQKHLGMALKHKDKKIIELMNELMEKM